MDGLHKVLAVIGSLAILGQAYLVRRRVGTWLFPACLFGLFWFAYTFFPLLLLFWVPVEPLAIGLIFLCTLAFSASSLPFDWRGAFDRKATQHETTATIYGSSFLKLAFLATVTAAVFVLVVNLYEQDLSLADMLFDLAASAAAYADLAYSESLNVNIYERLIIPLMLVTAALGGMIHREMPTKATRRIVVVLGLAPAALVSLTQTSKGQLLLCVMIFYGGLLARSVASGTFRLLERGSLQRVAPYVAILVAIITFAFIIRGRYDIDDDTYILERLATSYANYSSGHIYAFSDWFAFETGGHSEFGYLRQPRTAGFYTFLGPFQTLGSKRAVPLGIYDDFYDYDELLHTNVFTMFRGLVQDFGIFGTLVFMTVSGLLLHWAFRAMLSSRWPTFAVAIFVFTIGYFYYSFIVSFLSLTRAYLGLLVLGFILWLNRVVVTGREPERGADAACPERNGS